MQAISIYDQSPIGPAQEMPFAFTNPQHAGFESPGLMLPGRQPDTTSHLENTGPVRRRRTSKSVSSSALKRSASSPNVRSSQPEVAGNMMNDKKRNKLGYHRSSVACVHCRRRKIRCLPIPDSAQNRCVNCDKLKRECKYYPVGEQPPTQKRSRSGSKAENKSNGNSSASSSPEFAAGATTESVGETFSPYRASAMDMQVYPHGSRSNEPSTFSPPNSAAHFATNFDFAAPRQQWDQQSNHHLPYRQQQQQQQQQQQYEQQYHSDPSRREYWHQQPETPISPAYSYPPVPHSEQSSMHDGNAIYGLSRTAENVHPARSMSFSHVENLQHENDPFHAQVAMMAHDPHQRRATATSDMLPPSLRNSTTPSMASVTDVPPIAYPVGTAIPPSQANPMPFAWTSPGIPHSSQSPESTEFAHPGAMWSYAEQ